MLNPSQLSDMLAADWLMDDSGPHPDSVAQSADKFAGTVTTWFSAALAGPFPVTTAQAFRPILTALATPALMAQNPTAAGNLLATGVAVYMTGQSFGPGFSSPPIAQPPAAMMIGTAFSVLDLDRDSRAQMIATAIHLLAITSLVSFMIPPFAAPVT
ncbi:hypothetical protein QO034_10495 [Sedimentitalea sp. JM2-8]|uniref:Uncharacterized protein n=1 Tax=Sedimentitalea xiamensis TaxID=3050037 RepID=A0ABT7FEJ4_9RHOB|nr:hypothetical protein [Sedimentitalea xiamensis]MDK3073541.1 hypothetical protein [Sedimentitalea xiamensis]